MIPVSRLFNSYQIFFSELLKMKELRCKLASPAAEKRRTRRGTTCVVPPAGPEVYRGARRPVGLPGRRMPARRGVCAIRLKISPAVQ